MKKTLIIFCLIVFNLTLAKENIINKHSINVTAESRNDYILSGSDNNGMVNGNDPELTFKIGSNIDFIINAQGHPFFLKLKAGIGKKNQIAEIENNGVAKGTISWIPSKAGTYYYQCGKHKNMVGIIKIIK